MWISPSPANGYGRHCSDYGVYRLERRSDEAAPEGFYSSWQDTGPREAVARVLERLGFDPIILHEQPNRGRTIITKFQEEAADVGFAVVLMTPNDIGERHDLAPELLQARARQNVIFELGFFIGLLGPERVAALMKDTVERPSDFDGVVYIRMDEQGGLPRSGSIQSGCLTSFRSAGSLARSTDVGPSCC